IFVMFIIHGLILASVGVSPLIYFKKAMTTLIFAFTSRTSAGTLPLTIRTLTDEMGVDNGVSNLAGSLSTSIGQNGCAAIYPAMLVVMVAPAVGQPITPSFFILMVIIITFASIGIAGVGGGATFAGITVLSALGLPVGIAGLLVGIEPVIDMARTALNVSDGMVTGLVAAKLTKNIDMNVYNDKSVNLEKKSASSGD
ncbi:MAG: cation:dicarboxylase symporter family transporter, partial [Clostridium sp.]|nr:cation:dicarboxylase symporter family transporter [Clostridium sp.]